MSARSDRYVWASFTPVPAPIADYAPVGHSRFALFLSCYVRVSGPAVTEDRKPPQFARALCYRTPIRPNPSRPSRQLGRPSERMDRSREGRSAIGVRAWNPTDCETALLGTTRGHRRHGIDDPGGEVVSPHKRLANGGTKVGSCGCWFLCRVNDNVFDLQEVASGRIEDHLHAKTRIHR